MASSRLALGLAVLVLHHRLSWAPATSFVLPTGDLPRTTRTWAWSTSVVGEEGPAEVLSGRVQRIVYRGETGYTVASLRCGQGDAVPSRGASKWRTKTAEIDRDEDVGGDPLAKVTVVAQSCLAAVVAGDTLDCVGSWREDKRFGWQFVVERANLTTCSGSKEEGLRTWLRSGEVRGVGPATAERILEHFGERTQVVLDALASDTTDLRQSELLAVPGIGLAKLARIAEDVKQKWGNRQRLQQLLEMGLPLPAASAVADFFGSGAEHLMAADCHGTLVDADASLGFTRDERLAKKLGSPPDAPGRLRAGLLHVLNRETAQRGHCYLPIPSLLAAARIVLLVPGVFHPTAIDLLTSLRSLEVQELVKVEAIKPASAFPSAREEFVVFPLLLWRSERAVAKRVASRIVPRQRPSDLPAWRTGTLPPPPRPPERLRSSPHGSPIPSAAATAIVLTSEQELAVRLACREHLLLLTGGPGVGKTVTIRAVVAAWLDRGLRVGLTCPTARASMVLEDVTGQPASTIHRLLEWSVAKKAFQRHAGNPLELDALVVDEASMLDVVLGSHLLRALPPDCQVLLVGDKDQLPSVGPGSLFGDLLRVLDVPRVMLSVIFRQQTSAVPAAASSGWQLSTPRKGWAAGDIAQNANAVNQGRAPTSFRTFIHPRPKSDSSVPPFTDGCVLLHAETADEAARVVVDAVAALVQTSCPSQSIQVLSPVKRGAAGTFSLNHQLQRLVNPAATRARDAQSRTPRDVQQHHPPPLSEDSPRVFVGDRVVQLVNDYDNGIFNGDAGTVHSVARNGSFVVRFARPQEPAESAVLHTFRASDLDERVSLAYALTVHKAQGSEYPVVIVPVVASHGIMLQRALLYTAMSRARHLLVLVSTPAVLKRCASNAALRRRFTALEARTLDLVAPAASSPAPDTVLPGSPPSTKVTSPRS